MGNEVERWFGHWWLPQDRADRLSGVLEQDGDDNFRLELVGKFRTNIPQGSTVPIVHGVTNERLVTLLDSLQVLHQSPNSYGHPDIQRIRANQVLFGLHLDWPEEPCFTGATLRIENLMQFLYPGQDGVDRGGGEDRPDGSSAPPSAAVHGLTSHEFAFGGFTFRAWAEQWSFQTVRTRGRYTTQTPTTAKITIRSDEPRSFADISKYTRALMDLLTLASGQACGQISMDLTWTSQALARKVAARQTAWGQDPQLRELLADGTGADLGLRPEAEAQMRSKMVFKARPGGEPQEFFRYMFTCEDVPFEEIGPAWLELWQRLRPGIDIFFAQSYVPTGYLEQKTMEMGIAAEALHRELYDHLPMAPGDFKHMLSEILKQTEDPTMRRLVREGVNNRLTFSERLGELLVKPDQAAVDYVIPNREEWFDDLKAGRNGMAHGSSDKRQTLGEDQRNLRMVYLIKQTQLLIKLVLAQELSISAERQNRFIRIEGELQTYQSMLNRLSPSAEPTALQGEC